MAPGVSPNASMAPDSDCLSSRTGANRSPAANRSQTLSIRKSPGSRSSSSSSQSSGVDTGAPGSGRSE